MNTTACTTCQHPIIWTRTETGKNIPVNAQPHPEGTLVLTDEGAFPTAIPTARAPHKPGQSLYLNHLSQCRYADRKPPPPTAPPITGLFPEGDSAP